MAGEFRAMQTRLPRLAAALLTVSNTRDGSGRRSRHADRRPELQLVGES